MKCVKTQRQSLKEEKPMVNLVYLYTSVMLQPNGKPWFDDDVRPNLIYPGLSFEPTFIHHHGLCVRFSGRIFCAVMSSWMDSPTETGQQHDYTFMPQVSHKTYCVVFVVFPVEFV